MTKWGADMAGLHGVEDGVRGAISTPDEAGRRDAKIWKKGHSLKKAFFFA